MSLRSTSATALEAALLFGDGGLDVGRHEGVAMALGDLQGRLQPLKPSLRGHPNRVHPRACLGSHRRYLSPQLESTPPSALMRTPVPSTGTAASSISRSTIARTASPSASSHSTSTSSWQVATRYALNGS